MNKKTASVLLTLPLAVAFSGVAAGQVAAAPHNFDLRGRMNHQIAHRAEITVVNQSDAVPRLTVAPIEPKQPGEVGFGEKTGAPVPVGTPQKVGPKRYLFTVNVLKGGQRYALNATQSNNIGYGNFRMPAVGVGRATVWLTPLN